MILIRHEKDSNHLLPDQPIETTEHLPTLMNWSGKSKGSKKKKKLKIVFVNQNQNRCGNEKKKSTSVRIVGYLAYISVKMTREVVMIG